MPSSYTPTVWEDEVPASTPVKYVITDDDNGVIAAHATIEMDTSPTSGTPINATNMNHIEQGIAAAAVLTNRQGGSATNWNSFGGNNYSPAKSGIQCGAHQSGHTTLEWITFPVAFSYAPILFLQNVGTTDDILNIFSVGASGFSYTALNWGPVACPDIFWLAFGPVA